MASRLLVAAGVVIAFATTLHAEDPQVALTPNLAAVPADALAFVHIRVADIWKSEAVKEFRDTVMKAGEKALQGFDQRFLPHPSTIDQLTVVLVPQDKDLHKEPIFYALLSTTEAVQKKEFLRSSFPDAVEKAGKVFTYYADPKKGIAISFVSDKVIAVGPTPAIAYFASQSSQSKGALATALQQANSKQHFFAAVNASLIPVKSLDAVPEPFRPLLKAQVVTLAMDVTSAIKIDAAITYGDADQATAAQDAIRILAGMGRNQLKNVRTEMLAKVLGDGKANSIEHLPEAALALFALGSIEEVDQLLANPPIKRTGAVLNASIKLSASSSGGMVALSAVGVGLLLPAVQKVREAAARTASSNNLKQIGLAIHSYAADNGTLPPAAICDKNGKPLLSWRVALLPYIEQTNLYKEFKLDEPWDSEHNLKLSKVIVKVYTDPQQSKIAEGLCHYRLFYGKGAMFNLNEGTTFAQITDGTSNTIMVVEAGEGVPWTKPDDFAYDPKKPLPKFSTLSPGGFNVLMGDGSVHFLKNKITEKTLRALITANGGEVIGQDDW